MIGDILQPTHLLFILVIALLVLGPKRLPEAGRALGRGLRDFKGALSGDDDHPEMVRAHTPESTTGYTPGAQAEATDVTPAHPSDVTQPPTPEPAPTAKPDVTPAQTVGAEPVDATVESGPPARRPAEHIG